MTDEQLTAIYNEASGINPTRHTYYHGAHLRRDAGGDAGRAQRHGWSP